MVGFIDPRKSSERSQSHSQATSSNWLSTFTPVQIRIPAPGRHSPKNDEHCFSWFAQSARGRYDGQDPWCRTFCIRRVFAHEVKTVMAYSRVDDTGMPGHHAPTAQTYDLKYPLPPEGQPECAVVDGIVGGPDVDGRPSARDVRFWEEGWYIWMTKSRWATQEKMDLMLLDLERQTKWMRTKEMDERAWFESEVQRVRDNVRSMNQPEVTNDGQGAQPTAMVPNDYQEHYAPVRHPYPNISLESRLIRIPSSLPSMEVYLRRIFAPTQHLLSIVQESVESGAQRDLVLRMWDTTKSGAPLLLAKNVIRRCWDAFTKGPSSEEDP